jgi:AAA15 family ATPase/GTPase
MNKKDKQEIAEIVSAMLKANVTQTKKETAQPQGKPQAITDVPKILSKMTPTQLKKQFGTNIFEYKFTGIKDFMTKNNIQSTSKYPPRLNFENKHLILDIIAKSYKKPQQLSAIRQAIKTLHHKQKNPPKQLYGKDASSQQIEHINANLQTEIDRWNI